MCSGWQRADLEAKKYFEDEESEPCLMLQTEMVFGEAN